MVCDRSPGQLFGSHHLAAGTLKVQEYTMYNSCPVGVLAMLEMFAEQ